MAFSFFLGISFFFLPAFTYAVSLGATPAEVEFGKVLQTSTKERVIRLERNDDLRDDLTVMVTFQAGAEQVLQAEGRVYFPPGVRSISYPVTVDVSDLVLGDYEAIVQFSPVLPDGTISQTGLSVRLNYEVSNEEVREFVFHSVTPESVEEGEAIGIRFHFENAGNVLWKPDKLAIVVKDDRGRVVSQGSKQAKDLTTITPGASADYVVFAENMLPIGNYTVAVEALHDGMVLVNQELQVAVDSVGSRLHSGRLISLTSVADSIKNTHRILVTGAFVNEGESAHEAYMVLELSKGNEILRVERSKTERVAVQETHLFHQSFTVPESGDYRLVGYVVYKDKTTGTVIHDFTVVQPVFERMVKWSLIPLTCLLILLSFMLIFVHRHAAHRYSKRIRIHPVKVNDVFLRGFADAPNRTVVEIWRNSAFYGTAHVKASEWKMRVPESIEHGDIFTARIVHGKHDELETFSKEQVAI